MNWKNVVAGVAPAIGTALGGPGLGVAVSVIGKVLLGNDSASEDEVAAAVMSMPPSELALKLKEEDNRFKLESMQKEIDQSKINLENTSSARKMYMDKGGPQQNLSYIIVVGFFVVLLGVLVLFMTKGVDLSKEAYFLIGTLLGSLSTFAMLVLKFWFGGKPDDQETMDRMYFATPGEIKK